MSQVAGTVHLAEGKRADAIWLWCPTSVQQAVYRYCRIYWLTHTSLTSDPSLLPLKRLRPSSSFLSSAVMSSSPPAESPPGICDPV